MSFPFVPSALIPPVQETLPVQENLLPRPRRKHLIPGINYPLSLTTFCTARQYNSLPPLAAQAPIPSWALRRFGEIVTFYNLQQVLGAHLIYNRFAPSTIPDGSFVAATKVPLNAGCRTDPENGPPHTTEAGGGYEPAASYCKPGAPGPTVKKMIWQTGLWEVGHDLVKNPSIMLDVNLVRGRLFILSGAPVSSYYPSPSRHLQSDVAAYHLQPSHQHLLPPGRPGIHPLGTTHHFVAYEYEYGHIQPQLMVVPDAFWEDLAGFLIQNGLENRIGLEVLDTPEVYSGRLYAGPGRYVVEEYDINRNPRSSVIEVPTGKELSWSFSRSGFNPHDQSAGGLGEVNVLVNLVKLGYRRD
ncbi:hypothetical protein L211DRAFT_902094 [Terfezia boudieri ATCC MYA-4762]|uniref:Uncharacterized protein n=1 Tax=Terfezia boudieri ATCC MYA-4762 TaxID=1051890 RepID=A0A3N4LAL5_9PEZI|nr:hypothetical protein L211DRAFT_902094 [Terfezia boudieri ATCC MYA-4762]